MKPICLIAARGGSKGVPKKNIRKLAGKPLIAHTIEKALDSNIFSSVIVSTENKEIAKISKKFGAEVPFVRPKKLATDSASTDDVIIHAIIDALLGACRLKDIGTIFSNKNKKYKNIRSSKMLNKVLRLINQKGYSINNIDINVIAENPKISKYRNKIINSISKLCNIDKNKINIKGKTTEKLGLIGKEKAIAAEVITSVYKYD